MRSFLAGLVSVLLVAGQIRVDVDLVLVPATVNDLDGHIISGMQARHFQLWEDGVEQTIERVSTEEVPASVGIILDTSTSMKEMIESARRAALAFLKVGIREDEYFLIEFSGKPKLTVDFTTDIARLQERLIVGKAGGKTSALDALQMGLLKVKEGTRERKILLVISDGGDNHSKIRCSRVRDLSREIDAQVYWMNVQPEIRTRPQRPMPDAYVPPCGIYAILLESGGGLQRIDPDTNIVDMATRIAHALRSQYVIAYRSTNVAHDGKYRRVRVDLNLQNLPPDTRKLHVHAKPGYVAPG
jgi:Ca-activated chloride channel family protein